MAKRGTTTQTGQRFISLSGRVSRSTKKSRSSNRVFGTSSQMKGAGVGKSGDLRK